MTFVCNKLMGLALVLILLSGCTSISKEQCQLGDWYQIGVFDGQQGKTSMAADYTKDCAEHKATVDLAHYNKGRAEGLKSYCSYENGTLIGEQGKEYQKVCPANLSSQFLEGYIPYFNVSDTESKIISKKSEAARYKEELKDTSLDKDTKSYIKSSFKTAEFELSELQSKLNQYEYELAIHKIERKEAQLLATISDKDSSDAAQAHAKEQLVEVRENKQIIEDLYVTEKSIRDIKNIIDLF